MDEQKPEIDENLKKALFGVVFTAEATCTEDYAGLTVAIPKINAIFRVDKIKKETTLIPMNLVVAKDDKP